MITVDTNLIARRTGITGGDLADSITIGRVRYDGNRAEWTATVSGYDLETGQPFEGATITYHTDRDGDGLWVGDQQLRGSMQYRAGDRRRLVRETLLELGADPEAWTTDVKVWLGMAE